MTKIERLTVAALIGLALLSSGLWLRDWKQRLRADGALAEAMQAASAQRNADSLALAAAQDSLAVLGQALAQSGARVAASAGQWDAARAGAPAMMDALETFANPAELPRATASMPVSDSLAVMMRYARRLEVSGDSLHRDCTALRTDCEAFRAQAARTDSISREEKAAIQRQLAIAVAQARTRPGALSRWTRNAGLFLAGVGAGLVLERIR